MVNKKVSIRLIWSKAVESAWPHSVRVCDWSDHRRVHIGVTKNRNKTCESWNICPSNKWDWSDEVQSCAVASVQGCVVVDWQCRGSNGKVKIEGYMSVSEEAHQCDVMWPHTTRCDHIQSHLLAHDTHLHFIRPASLIWWTDVLQFTGFISILSSPMCLPAAWSIMNPHATWSGTYYSFALNEPCACFLVCHLYLTCLYLPFNKDNCLYEFSPVFRLSACTSPHLTFTLPHFTLHHTASQSCCLYLLHHTWNIYYTTWNPGKSPQYTFISFENMLSNCWTQIQFDDFTSESINITNRTMQGCPLSMILYAYYNINLINIATGKHELSTGFVNNCAFVATGESIIDTHQILKDMMEQTGGGLEWSHDHNSPFELTKLTVMDFHCQTPFLITLHHHPLQQQCTFLKQNHQHIILQILWSNLRLQS